MVLGGGSAIDGGDRAVRGLESLARFEVICRNELVQVGVPEEVVSGGVDDLDAVRGFDVEVVEVGVVVDLDGGDGFRAGLAGGRVRRFDFVAGFEAGDGGGLAAGEQDRGAGGEAHAAQDGEGVFPGGAVPGPMGCGGATARRRTGRRRRC